MNILTVDVGSTYTKLTAIDGDQRRILGTSQAFTTIETDVMQGFQEAFDRLTEDRNVLKLPELLFRRLSTILPMSARKLRLE